MEKIQKEYVSGFLKIVKPKTTIKTVQHALMASSKKIIKKIARSVKIPWKKTVKLGYRTHASVKVAIQKIGYRLMKAFVLNLSHIVMIRVRVIIESLVIYAIRIMSFKIMLVHSVL
jgi:hypothetical protein